MIFFAAYILAMIAIKYVPNEFIKYLIIPVGIFCELTALKYAPVEHPNRPVSKRKKKKFKRTGIILLTLFWIAAIVLITLFTGIEKYALSIILGMFYMSISVVAEFYKQYRKNLLQNR